MLYKKGPRGTLRLYNPSNGRYAKEDYSHLTTKEKLPYKEKLRLKLEQIRNRANNSKDKNLLTIFNLIESIRPGIVRHINDRIYDPALKKYREIDIITKDTLYEIKSGTARHKVRQYKSQQKLADYLGKKFVVYSPESTNYQIECIRREGIVAFNKITEFENNERKI